MRVVVFHQSYGCASGCCGHVIHVTSGPAVDAAGSGLFLLSHPGGTPWRTFAEELVRAEHGDEHVANLAWDDCVIVDD